MRLIGAKLANIDNLDRLTGGPIFLHVVVFDAYFIAAFKLWKRSCKK